MDDTFYNGRICGAFVADNGDAFLCCATPDGGRTQTKFRFSPFAWTSREMPFDNFADLRAPENGVRAPLDRILRFADPAHAEEFFKKRDKSLPYFRLPSVENQLFTERGLRPFAEMRFGEIRRMQLDIEVASADDSFPNASRAEDRIIAVGMAGCAEKIAELESFDDDAERRLLLEVQNFILDTDPDFIEGHNIFKFDLPYIAARCKRLGLEMKWGRFGQPARFRKSRINIAERTINYSRCDLPGRTVVDTLLLVQLFDVSAREMVSYTLKESAIHFGISKRENRTYIDGGEIKNAFVSDRETFRKYLRDDLRETAGLSAYLLPTYVAQARNFPMTMQECLLRGNGMKVESVFIQKYFDAKAALPMPSEQSAIEGALSESFELGLFKNVLHYDVASLYPSLMLVIGKCPKNDYLGTFLDELSRLREYRLKYKKLARDAENPADKLEFDARQKSFKILINSFYGYLGLSTAVFGDSALAGEITALGRNLLQKLMDKFRELGCTVLEADTDGIYVSSEEYFSKPEVLLEKAESVLPDGVDLDFDGAFEAMLCYKAKNYALLSNGKITLRGSTFRNRATEPFLQKLTQTLVSDIILERNDEIPALISRTTERILSGEMPVSELAKSEFITKSPSLYQKEIAATGKGRRASMEAALLMKPIPSAGDKVSYYIRKLDGKKNPDWKCAYPLELFDADTAPYSPEYYTKKITDWQKRFSELIDNKRAPVQSELFTCW